MRARFFPFLLLGKALQWFYIHSTSGDSAKLGCFGESFDEGILLTR
jgi:hypothetical protein